jgi:type IV pilus assembly protein PilE
MTARSKGFTLAEILTALVVIAVLTAIAIPAWRAHLLRVRRADATAALLALQAAQDRHFARRARYAATPLLERAPPQGLGLPATSPHGHYDLTLDTDADGFAYRAFARPRTDRGQADDLRCAEFSIDQNGQRRALDAEGRDRSADCWR